jgi:glycine oxidase
VTDARNTPHVVVVGGGIAGAFSAYFLARLGARPTLVERGEIGGQASGRSAGNLAPCHGTGIPGPLQDLALASFRLHLEHANAIRRLAGVDVSPRSSRRLHVALDERDVVSLEAARGPYDTTPGFSARWLDPAEALALEPRLAPSLAGAMLVEGNRKVDGGPYTRAVAAAAVALGGGVVRAEVRDVVSAGDRVTGVRLDAGVLSCDALVLATGPWYDEPARWLDTSLPVEPVRGELLLVELPGGALAVDVGRGRAAAYRTADGRALLGDTEDRAGFDDKPTVAGRDRILAAAAAFLPAVEHARVLRHTAGLRPVTPDGLPIAGFVEPWENVCIAGGAGRKGILLGAGLGLATAEFLVHGETALPIGACSPARWVGAPAA